LARGADIDQGGDAAGSKADDIAVKVPCCDASAGRRQVKEMLELPTFQTTARQTPISPPAFAVIRRDPEALAKFREEMKHQGERTDLDDNVIEVERQPRGNSRAYSIARVQRECDPETVAAVMAGEMLARMENAKTGPKELGNTTLPNSLDDLGIDKMQSSRWQREAKAFLRDDSGHVSLLDPTLQG
jgi:hypothetical protein